MSPHRPGVRAPLGAGSRDRTPVRVCPGHRPGAPGVDRSPPLTTSTVSCPRGARPRRPTRAEHSPGPVSSPGPVPSPGPVRGGRPAWCLHLVQLGVVARRRVIAGPGVCDGPRSSSGPVSAPGPRSPPGPASAARARGPAPAVRRVRPGGAVDRPGPRDACRACATRVSTGSRVWWCAPVRASPVPTPTPTGRDGPPSAGGSTPRSCPRPRPTADRSGASRR